MEKVIMHVDMDAFFAAVEVHDNPKLKGKPVIVGGTSERGVVSTCSYEARKYGVKSAMPVYIAKSKCPNGIFLPPRIGRYKEVSKEIFSILRSVTPYVEPLSIDEAYLDITNYTKNSVSTSKFIKEAVMKKTGLTLSVGISYNKFLAKLASDWDKPNGLTIIRKNMMPQILFPLPISKVYGLGKKSVKKLNDIGVFSIEELYKLPKDILIEFFGKYGIEVYDRIRGIDNRTVQILRQTKSIGRENTLKRDTDDKNELKEYLKAFSISISKQLLNKGFSAKTVILKTKTSSFENHTRSKTLPSYIYKPEDIYQEACEVLMEITLTEKVRLIGLSVSSLKENSLKQISLFDS
ncbi:DNA polymerase IV [Clostridium homopropionicum DSM 5847]|uniref:DNA polymerase IV n=1 Tax=Clostridium homopropionicum DSM 5847 TaxID=1121318 RepID=A0A0L6Z6P4_9CLOT|nr:DNA polymerase IV [Clostridium homopropionicum]KOA18634.1 DNA polymerase IV [Clostridium homopropionicum DSM 5847]SFG50792.1 DNA polymerase-4 [Clostridium homopropionicum]